MRAEPDLRVLLKWMMKLPAWNIQSANPIGKQNIAALLDSFDRTMGKR